MLGSTLDQNLGTTNGSSVQNQALNLSLGSFHTSQNNGGTVTVAPYQVTHSSTGSSSSLTMTSGSSDLGLQTNQAMAVANKHLGTSQRATQGTGTSQSTTINWHQQGGQQSAQSNVTLSSAPVQATPVSAAVPTAAVGTHSIDLKLTTQTISNDHRPPYTGVWASYALNPAANGFDTSALYKVVQVGGGANATLYAVGEATDGSTGSQDIFLVATQAGSTSATVATLGSGNPGDAKGYSIALDSTGNNLIIGGTVTDSNGNTAGLVASVSTSLTTLNWNFGFAGPSAVNGVTDPNGTVVFTGAAVDANSQQDLLVGTTDDATGTATSAFIYAFSQVTNGHAVAVDGNTGNIDVAGTFAGTGTDDPSLFQLPPDLSSASGAYFAGAGSMNGVQVDAAGNAYWDGSIINNSGTVGNIVYKTNPDLTPSADYSGSGWVWSFTIGGIPANAPAYDNKIDGAGDQLQELTVDDNSGTAGSHGQLFFDIGPTGQTFVEFGDGTINGALDDYGYGIAIDASNPINTYTVGKTDSTNFNTNGFQNTLPSGDTFGGWIANSTSP